ncbi:glycosyltransferase [Marinitenerispora sediminis]|uniref:Glycosyl transferase n=1 Tax=Marinitenerispora sediminis TaxID=1931232 RepID=A0A368SZ23_9ACTN|nr:glycosyltransferase [Marinitenerispora sediminis]RCV47851.1 glycosyl transferase [Marinitenerispora sediminis]RCV48898.1 glycosyl transferase [Marinitenerispora sediminis]RCV50448.1 glycosyl transferase [Marinitenerispora sediminis]
MRIAMVSEHASPIATLGGEDAGGQNVHVAELARALGTLGHEVTVYTRRTGRAQPDTIGFAPGVVVRHVGAGPARTLPKDALPRYMPRFGDVLAREWAGTPPDVVHAHYWMSGVAALRAAEPLDIPVVLTLHALGTVKRRFQGEQDSSPAERIATERDIAHRSALIIATSAEERRELRSWRVPADRISVVPCGVDLERFTPEGAAEPRGERPRLLSLGRLVQRKGVETVIRALVAVPDAELVVAGGPGRSELTGDPEAARLRRIAEQIGVADRVRFVGRVARADVPALLRSADVAINMPWYEPFGISTVEAMACGVPVIASSVGGHLDTVVNEVTGVLLPPREPALLAVRLRRLLADPVSKDSYGIAAADRAAARYSWPLIARQTEDRYRAVLEDWRTGRRPARAPGDGGASPAGRAAAATAVSPGGI